MEELAQLARDKKEEFLKARARNADFDTMKRIAKEYGEAVKAWHKVRFPNKRFTMPSVGYLTSRMHVYNFHAERGGDFKRLIASHHYGDIHALACREDGTPSAAFPH